MYRVQHSYDQIHPWVFRLMFARNGCIDVYPPVLYRSQKYFKCMLWHHPCVWFCQYPCAETVWPSIHQIKQSWKREKDILFRTKFGKKNSCRKNIHTQPKFEKQFIAKNKQTHTSFPMVQTDKIFNTPGNWDYWWWTCLQTPHQGFLGSCAYNCTLKYPR